LNDVRGETGFDFIFQQPFQQFDRQVALRHQANFVQKLFRQDADVWLT
jgi:hypothetical protein